MAAVAARTRRQARFEPRPSLDERQRANVLAVQVHGHVVLESDNRQRRFLRGLHIHFDRAAIPRGAASFESLADVILRDER